MPRTHKPAHVPPTTLPPSLVEAIDAFLLCCTARRLRGDGRDHCSMLVHVTRYNAVQQVVRAQVEEHVRHLRQRLLRGIDHEPIIARLHAETRADAASPAELRCRRFAFLLYLDRSCPAGTVDVDRREEMQALDLDLFNSFMAECHRREASRS